MPFADHMPTVVFPDTVRGRRAWESWERSSTTVPYFCDLYDDDMGSWTGHCARRDPGGVRAHSLCWRCVAGFLYDIKRSVEQEGDERLTA